jgi:hypothetical protein
MATSSNGRAKKPKKAASNAQLNGTAKTQANGHLAAAGNPDKAQQSTTVVRSSKKSTSKRTVKARLFSVYAR